MKRQSTILQGQLRAERKAEHAKAKEEAKAVAAPQSLSKTEQQAKKRRRYQNKRNRAKAQQARHDAWIERRKVAAQKKAQKEQRKAERDRLIQEKEQRRIKREQNKIPKAVSDYVRGFEDGKRAALADLQSQRGFTQQPATSAAASKPAFKPERTIQPSWSTDQSWKIAPDPPRTWEK